MKVKNIMKENVDSFHYEDHELSGVFAIDEQFPCVNVEDKARIVLMDPHQYNS